MSDLTKRALSEALMVTLKEKHFEKITVQELTSKCSLTRNAFYYHFKDIYDLLQYFFLSELQDIKSKYAERKNWEGGLEYGLRYIYNHKAAVKNIYQSINHELVAVYVDNIAFEHAMMAITQQFAETVEPLTEAQRNDLVNFYKNALLGTITTWLANGMNVEPEKLGRDFDRIFRGTIEAAAEAVAVAETSGDAE